MQSFIQSTRATLDACTSVSTRTVALSDPLDLRPSPALLHLSLNSNSTTTNETGDAKGRHEPVSDAIIDHKITCGAIHIYIKLYICTNILCEGRAPKNPLLPLTVRHFPPPPPPLQTHPPARAAADPHSQCQLQLRISSSRNNNNNHNSNLLELRRTLRHSTKPQATKITFQGLMFG